MAAARTTNIDLYKPKYNDLADVGLLNTNMDILDQVIGDPGNSSIASQLQALRSKDAVICIKGSTTTISGNGTQSVNCSGLTINHRLCNWGLSIGSESEPPADIEIQEGNGSYTIIVTNYGGTQFTITPVFIQSQN